MIEVCEGFLVDYLSFTLHSLYALCARKHHFSSIFQLLDVSFTCKQLHLTAR